MNIGTVIVQQDTPNPHEFSFVLNKPETEITIKLGMYILVPIDEGEVIATIMDVFKTNRYFSSPSAVKGYEESGRSLSSIFPSDSWEYIIAKAKPLGIITDGGIRRLLSPISPGLEVYLAENEILREFLGFNHQNGLKIGKILEHELDVEIDLTRMLQKHAALLAISGAGKSYTTSVIIEEILSRKQKDGRIALVLFDVHGEYKGLGSPSSPFKDQVEVFPGPFIQFATHKITAGQFAMLQPQISPAQLRELYKILGRLYQNKIKKGQSYLLNDIIQEIENDETINVRSREALAGWLYTLENTHLFGPIENPNLKESIRSGHLLIIDLSEFTSLRKKQMIVAYILQRLFDLRKKNKIPPATVVIEESHQFCPEASISLALSRSIIETIAREGRKFFLSLLLISQRPVKLSTTALSQCNTHLIMRILNPYDLDFIAKSSEGINRETLDAITILGIGEAIIVGNAVNYPLFLKIRERETRSLETQSLIDIAKTFDNNE